MKDTIDEGIGTEMIVVVLWTKKWRSKLEGLGSRGCAVHVVLMGGGCLQFEVPGPEDILSRSQFTQDKGASPRNLRRRAIYSILW